MVILTVKPGATLNFGSATYLDVNDGKLDAQGTVTDSITFHWNIRLQIMSWEWIIRHEENLWTILKYDKILCV